MNCNTCLKKLSDNDIGIQLVRGCICNKCFNYKCRFCKRNISKECKYIETVKEFINVCETCKFLKPDYHVLKS